MSVLAKSSALKFRWINGQCFEFKLNNGKTLLTDPWFSGGGNLASKCPKGFTVDDIEGADYIFLNHTHGDHTANLGEVYKKFGSTIICHSAVALELARSFDMKLTSIYPVDYEGTYYFDGFILETHHATHHAQGKTLEDTMQWLSCRDDYAGTPTLNAMGSIFNMNFILTTDQGMRIGFIGGNEDDMIKRMVGKDKPNRVIRNKMASSKHKEGAAEKFADWFAQSDIQLLVPMHYETWLTDDPEFSEKVHSDMNRIMNEKGLIGKVAPMERGRWYTLDLSIVEA